MSTPKITSITNTTNNDHEDDITAISDKLAQKFLDAVIETTLDLVPGSKIITSTIRTWDDIFKQTRLKEFLLKFRNRLSDGNVANELRKIFSKTPVGLCSKHFLIDTILNMRDEVVDDYLLNLFLNYLDNQIEDWKQFRTLCLVLRDLDTHECKFISEHIQCTTLENLSDYMLFSLQRLNLIKPRADFNGYDFTDIARDLHRFALLNRKIEYRAPKDFHLDYGTYDEGN